MSTELLIALTVIEVVALLGVLALFLDEVARRLRAIAAGLAELSSDVRTVGQHVRAIGGQLGSGEAPSR
jgi:hypothetical protein